MAGSTIFTGGTADTLGHLVPFGRKVFFLIPFKYHGRFDGIARTGRKLFVGAGLFMADQAVDLGLVAEVERHVLETISGMTASAARIAAMQRNTKIVDGQSGLADPIFRGNIRVQPGPVDGLLKLHRRL